MLQYVIRRALWSVVMLILVLALVFAIFFVLPGGSLHKQPGQKYPPIAYTLAGKHPTPPVVRSVVERLDLDKPIYVQFFSYLGNALKGNLGYSYQTHEAVTKALIHRLPPTIGLAIGASIIWLLMGCGIGIISALKRRSLLDRSSMIFALAGLSLPTFWLGLVAVFFFDARLGIYDTGAYVGITKNPWLWLKAMWLPWLVLAFVSAAIYSRMVRGNMLDVAGEDYIRTARAKGLTERSVIRHELRSALTPVVTMYGLDLGILLGGAIVTEHIFNIPGIGAYSVDAIRDQNIPIVLGTTLVAAFFIIAANLIVDVVYAILDPRVTYS
jgi:peptide/nickel transport system permease protein